MAISLRRAILSSRNLSCALRTASIRSAQTFPYLNSSFFDNSHETVVVDRFLSSQATDFYHYTSRRGFAKARKQKIKEEKDDVEEEEEQAEEENDEDEEGVDLGASVKATALSQMNASIEALSRELAKLKTIYRSLQQSQSIQSLEENDEDEEGVDLGASVKATAESQMNASIEALSRELAKLRTGRPSAGMLDHIMVEHYGVKTPLNRMANVSVPNSKTLYVSPFDSNALKKIEKAIISSPLGLNPQADSQRLIVPIPPLTKEEHVQAASKEVVKLSKDVKQSIRRARQKALDRIKKAVPKKDAKRSDKEKSGSSTKKDRDKAGPSISEDDAKRLEKDIDDLTKNFIKSAEDMCKAKEKDIILLKFRFIVCQPQKNSVMNLHVKGLLSGAGEGTVDRVLEKEPRAQGIATESG